MNYAVLEVSTEVVNRTDVDNMITKFIVANFDRRFGRVSIKSIVCNGIFTMTVFCSLVPPVHTNEAMQKCVAKLTAWDKLDPTLFVDFMVNGPICISPVEEYIEMIEVEYGQVVLPEDLEQC